jgi:hypothetical protein
MFDILIELSATQDGLVFLLVRFLLESSLTPVELLKDHTPAFVY